MTRQKLRKLISRARKHARDDRERKVVEQWVELIEERGPKRVTPAAFGALREIDTRHHERKLSEANGAMAAGDWRKIEALMMRTIKSL